LVPELKSIEKAQLSQAIVFASRSHANGRSE